MSQPPTMNSMRALLYKDICLQLKHPCSLLCHIITLILCICFTLTVRVFAEGFTIGKVPTLNFPLPFHLPFTSLIISQTIIPLSCQQIYFYEAPQQIQNSAEKLLQRVLKSQCGMQTMPKFKRQQFVNAAVLDAFSLANQAKLQGYQLVKKGLELPDGIIRFEKLNNHTMKLILGINDWRLSSYHKNNGVTLINFFKPTQHGISYLRVTQGLLSLIEKINRAYLSLLDDQEVIFGTMMYMPFAGQDKALLNKIINIVGVGVYAIALSLLLPLLLYTTISEKQSKLLLIMQINSLSRTYYFLHLFLNALLMNIFSFTLLVGMGKCTQISYFSETNSTIFAHICLGWTFSLSALVLLAHHLVDTSRAATIVGYLLSIFSTLIGSVLSTTIYPDPTPMPTIYLCYPPFAFARVMYLVGVACSSPNGCLKLASQETQLAIILLYAWGTVFGAALWIVARRTQILFIIENYLQQQTLRRVLPQEQSIVFSQQFPCHIDQSVQLHRIYTQEVKERKPLRVINISKTYANGYNAVESVTLCLQQNEITGLLGANGAGKTTLLSMMTGAVSMSSGSGWIGGYEIGSEAARRALGVCPQFDALWPDLTPVQHLTFFTLLKQVSEEVQGTLRRVDLYAERHTAVKRLSGGMQRRLSLAIALLGNPTVILLDEPTSGLDPSHRRHIWDILLACRRTVLLTTHLMEEAEALCDRITIMNHGRINCFGRKKELMDRLAGGYNLRISGEGTARIAHHMQQSYQSDVQKELFVHVGKEELLKWIAVLRKDKSVKWTVSQPSLSDLFAKFTIY